MSFWSRLFGGGESAGASSGRSASVEVFFEPSPVMRAITQGGGVASQLVSDALLANLVRGADSGLDLSGRLVNHIQTHGMPGIQTVDEMDNDQWAEFLDRRYGSNDWNRWFAKNSGNRWNIVVRGL